MPRRRPGPRSPSLTEERTRERRTGRPRRCRGRPVLCVGSRGVDFPGRRREVRQDHSPGSRREDVGVLLEPLLHGLGFLALAELVDDHVLEGAELLVGQGGAGDPLVDVREVLAEAQATQVVQGLGLAEVALGILERLHRVGGHRPERGPERDDDVLFGIDRVLQLGDHRRGGGGDQLVLVETVTGDHALLGGLGEAGAGLDAHDAAAEAVSPGPPARRSR